MDNINPTVFLPNLVGETLTEKNVTIYNQTVIAVLPTRLTIKVPALICSRGHFQFQILLLQKQKQA